MFRGFIIRVARFVFYISSFVYQVSDQVSEYHVSYFWIPCCCEVGSGLLCFLDPKKKKRQANQNSYTP